MKASPSQPRRPLPLSGLRVLDFSTLLPGPLATLLLAEAGAEVIKIERPGVGDEARDSEPRFGADSVDFALLNRGKRSLCVDLKQHADRARLLPLVETADVLVEQFRPGVMARLGLDYQTVQPLNPRLVYCSITGYGQRGARAQWAGHDLEYLASTGLLALSAGTNGEPVIPPALIADIAGGSYPAVMNILLALRARDATGAGCHLDVSMTDNLFPLMFWALGKAALGGGAPVPGAERLTGGSPRYRIYATRDGRYVAAAPLEDRFWRVFCDVIGLDRALRDDRRDADATAAAVARIIASETAQHWSERFAGRDVCSTVVRSLEDALNDPHFRERGLFAHALIGPDGERLPALPVPLHADFRRDGEAAYPALGEANSELLNHPIPGPSD